MNTREALIAAVAATPDDNLPRLVAADWFEENGEPERAQFIRTQITDASAGIIPNSAPADSDRTRTLFTSFVSVLEQDLSAPSRFKFYNECITPRIASPPPWCLLRADIRRGFVRSVELAVKNAIEWDVIERAFWLEPVTALQTFLPTAAHWHRLTAPVLSRIVDLTIRGPVGHWRPEGLRAVFHDQHMQGVRKLSLLGWARRLVGAAGISENVLRELTDSPFREQLTELWVALEPTHLPASENGYDCPSLAAYLQSRAHPLERLVIVGNRAAGITSAFALGDALCPETISELHINNGVVRIPAPQFLRERFGDRLKIHAS